MIQVGEMHISKYYLTTMQIVIALIQVGEMHISDWDADNPFSPSRCVGHPRQYNESCKSSRTLVALTQGNEQVKETKIITSVQPGEADGLAANIAHT